MEGEKGSSSAPLLGSNTKSSPSDSSSYSSEEIMKRDFSELIKHFSEYRPSYISTPFKGTCLEMTKNKKNFVFGSREGRIAVCDIEHKQLTLDKDLNEGSIWSISITSDDKTVFSGGQGGQIRKLSLSTLTQESVLEGHTDEVNHVIVSNDDRHLYSASDDTTVRRWNLAHNHCEVLYSHPGKVYALDLSEDGIHVASACSEGQAVVFNNVEGSQKFEVKIEGSVMWCVKISAKNTYLVVGDQLANIYVWSFGDWVLKRVLKGHKDRVRCLQISSNEKFLVSGGIDSLVKVWDLEHWRDEETIYGHSDWVKGIIISQDLKSIHTMGDDCRIMTSKVPELSSHINWHTEHAYKRFLHNPREHLVYSATDYSLNLSKNNKTFDHLHQFPKRILDWSLTFSGTKLAVFLQQEKSTETEVELIDLFGGRNSKGVVLKTSSVVSSALATEDGEYYITGEAFRVTVWTLQTGEIKHIFRTHSAEVTALALNGRHLFAGDRSGIVKYYFIATEGFQEITQFAEENQTEITLIRLSSDLKIFLSATATNNIHIWSIETKSIITEINLSGPAKQIHLTNDLRHCFFSYDNFLEIWNLENYSRCSVITLGAESVDFGFTHEEKEIYISFNDHVKKIDNPLKTQNLQIYGDHNEAHNFVEYITKIISGEVPKYQSHVDNWIIEPYHINVLHLYAYFNLNKHLEKSLKANAPFFPSRHGYTALSISIDKKLGECIDAIFETMKTRAEKSPLAFYYFSNSIPALNRSSYPKLHQLYEMAFCKSSSSTLPKFCDDSVDLPIVKQSPELLLTKERFMDNEKYHSEVVAIEFLQSYVKINTTLGSSDSLEFLKSLIECKNLEVYSTGLIKMILEQKWKVIRWVFICETLLYIVYLTMLCYYSTFEEDRTADLLIAPFAINVLLFLNEIVQMISGKLLYFKSFWNYIDMFRFLIFSLYFILETFFQESERRRDIFLLSAVILSLIRGLSYFRIHSTTRWVVNLIFDVFYQLWALILVAAYSILALGVVYQSLITDENFKNAYANDVENFKLQWIMFFFVLIINPIIMLNLFITIIGDAFEKSQDEKTVKDGQELAEMVFEGELLMFWNRRNTVTKFMHVVREEHMEMHAQNTAGQRIKKIAENIATLNQVAFKNKSDISELKVFVENKIVEIQRKTEEVLEIAKQKFT